MKFAMSLKVSKRLLLPPEKARIIAAMRASHVVKHAMAWSMEFKRLPNTIRALAKEAGVTLLD